MRLLCIKEGPWTQLHTGLQRPGPKYMEEVTKDGEYIWEDEEHKLLCYWLVEYPYPRSFSSKHFIPLSGEPEEVETEVKEIELETTH